MWDATFWQCRLTVKRALHFKSYIHFVCVVLCILCARQLEDALKAMLTSLPLVAELHHPSMRERHWYQLMKAPPSFLRLLVYPFPHNLQPNVLTLWRLHKVDHQLPGLYIQKWLLSWLQKCYDWDVLCRKHSWMHFWTYFEKEVLQIAVLAFNALLLPMHSDHKVLWGVSLESLTCQVASLEASKRSSLPGGD